MQIVGPVVVEPLMAEGDCVKAEIATTLDKAAQEKARATRTRAGKAAALQNGFLEHGVNLASEAPGLSRGFPRIGPECVPGIELTPTAADHAVDPRAQQIATTAVRLNELRENRLNPSDLVDHARA